MMVEVYAEEEILLFEADFDFLPRTGETISTFSDDYFKYYDVKDVWHRQEPSAGFKACLTVVLND